MLECLSLIAQLKIFRMTSCSFSMLSIEIRNQLYKIIYVYTHTHIYTYAPNLYAIYEHIYTYSTCIYIKYVHALNRYIHAICVTYISHMHLSHIHILCYINLFNVYYGKLIKHQLKTMQISQHQRAKMKNHRKKGD